jgi:L-alanine-DL-glutamate epimerase-like enolase superfamily enzyme
MHLSKPVELADNWERAKSLFSPNPSEPVNGHFELPTVPGLGMEFDEAEMKRRAIPIST